MQKDEQLMAEIIALEEYSPIDVYQDDSEKFNGYFDEEFVEFVVPLEENQDQA